MADRLPRLVVFFLTSYCVTAGDACLILLVLRPVSIGVLQQPPLGAGEMFQGLFPGLYVLKLTHLKPFVSHGYSFTANY